MGSAEYRKGRKVQGPCFLFLWTYHSVTEELLCSKSSSTGLGPAGNVPTSHPHPILHLWRERENLQAQFLTRAPMSKGGCCRGLTPCDMCERLGNNRKQINELESTHLCLFSISSFLLPSWHSFGHLYGFPHIKKKKKKYSHILEFSNDSNK